MFGLTSSTSAQHQLNIRSILDQPWLTVTIIRNDGIIVSGDVSYLQINPESAVPVSEDISEKEIQDDGLSLVEIDHRKTKEVDDQRNQPLSELYACALQVVVDIMNGKVLIEDPFLFHQIVSNEFFNALKDRWEEIFLYDEKNTIIFAQILDLDKSTESAEKIIGQFFTLACKISIPEIKSANFEWFASENEKKFVCMGFPIGFHPDFQSEANATRFIEKLEYIYRNGEGYSLAKKYQQHALLFIEDVPFDLFKEKINQKYDLVTFKSFKPSFLSDSSLTALYEKKEYAELITVAISKQSDLTEKEKKQLAISSRCIHDIGTKSYHDKAYDKAIEELKSAVSGYAALGAVQNEGVSLNNLAACYRNQGDKQAALIHYRDALKKLENCSEKADLRKKISDNIKNLDNACSIDLR